MSARLFVLGLLNERDSHGYELREVAQAWNLHEWADISYGAIYHALSTLQREGLVEEIRVEQIGDRPPRAVCRITAAGRAAFYVALREAAATDFRDRHPINLALAFLAELPPEERVALLQERLRRLEARQEKVVQVRRSLIPLETSAPAAIAAVEHDLGHIAFEIAWTRDLLDQVPLWRPRTRRSGATE
jgi:DNA-binding PadR family transcriptional regulator